MTPRDPVPLWLWHRLEGGAILGASIIAFWRTDESWLLFALLFLAPDLMALGYLAGRRVGATAYNLGHTIVGPLILAVVASGGPGWDVGGWCLPVALIWLAHIGMDRLIGYDLKSPVAGDRKSHRGAGNAGRR